MSNPSDHNVPALIAVASALLALSFITGALRFYARHHQNAALMMDDWLIIPGFVSQFIALFYLDYIFESFLMGEIVFGRLRLLALVHAFTGVSSSPACRLPAVGFYTTES